MDITNIIEAIITLLFAIITTFVIPYIKKKTTNEQLDEILKWVKIAVQAAEMIYAGSGRGSEKKQYVIDYLASMGYKLDSDEVDNLIESAVLELKHELKGE